MWLFLAFASIIALAALAGAARKVFGAQICPICAGVSATWLWLLFLYRAGYAVDRFLLGLLMGSSVVGIVYVLERRSGKSLLPSAKAWLILSGYVAAYGLYASWPMAFGGTLLFLGSLWLLRLLPRRGGKPALPAARELEEKMKQCC